MQDIPKWAQKWRPLHLPTTWHFLTTDARMDKFKESDWQTLLSGRTLLTNAFADCEAIISKEKETFGSLDLILTGSNIHDDVATPKNPKLGKDTSRMEGEQQAPYGTCLQVLERLVQEGLKLGIIPEAKGSDYLKRYHPLSPAEEKLPLHPAAKPKVVEKENLVLLLTGKQGQFEGNPTCPIILHSYENIGVEWTNPEGTRQAWIKQENPFIRVILTQESLFLQNPNTNLEFLCNPAFIALSKRDTKTAQKMADLACEDTFFYQSQDAEQSYFDLDMFHDENGSEIDTLWDRSRLLQKAKESLSKSIAEAMETYLKDTCPEVETLLINRWKKDATLHLKFLQLKGGKITFDSTLETNGEVLFIKGEAGKDNPPEKKVRKEPDPK